MTSSLWKSMQPQYVPSPCPCHEIVFQPGWSSPGSNVWSMAVKFGDPSVVKIVFPFMRTVYGHWYFT